MHAHLLLHGFGSHADFPARLFFAEGKTALGDGEVHAVSVVKGELAL